MAERHLKSCHQNDVSFFSPKFRNGHPEALKKVHCLRIKLNEELYNLPWRKYQWDDKMVYMKKYQVYVPSGICRLMKKQRNIIYGYFL